MAGWVGSHRRPWWDAEGGGRGQWSRAVDGEVVWQGGKEFSNHRRSVGNPSGSTRAK